MSIYGKGRTKRNSAHQRPKPLMRIRRLGKKRTFERIDEWKNISTPLRKIEESLGFNISGEISQRTRQATTPVVVLDWGCGAGNAAEAIAAKFGKKVSVYGCSDTSYKEWHAIKTVKLVQATKEDALRYFKKGTMDFIYSHLGLSHTDLASENYLEKLLLKLRLGGKLVTDINRNDFPTYYTPGQTKTLALKNAVFELEYGFTPKNQISTEYRLIAKRIN